MANFKNMRLAVLLGRVTALLVALAVIAAIGMAAACPWMCDTVVARGERCDAPVSIARQDRQGARVPTGHPRWHAGDKF